MLTPITIFHRPQLSRCLMLRSPWRMVATAEKSSGYLIQTHLPIMLHRPSYLPGFPLHYSTSLSLPAMLAVFPSLCVVFLPIYDHTSFPQDQIKVFCLTNFVTLNFMSFLPPLTSHVYTPQHLICRHLKLLSNSSFQQLESQKFAVFHILVSNHRLELAGLRCPQSIFFSHL